MVRIRSPELSPQSKRAALVGGIFYVLILLVTPHVMGFGGGFTVESFFGALFSVQVGPWLWWAFIGGGIVGAVLAVTFVRYGLVTPILSVIVMYAFSMYQMWQLLQAPYPLLPGTPYDFYLIGWPILLLIALGVGAIEWRVQTAISPPTNPT